VPKPGPLKLPPNLPSPPTLTPNPNSQPVTTPVNVERLGYLLSGYNPQIAPQLMFGFKYGFSIHYEGNRVSRQPPNLLSASGA
jgi:hypothetical protein